MPRNHTIKQGEDIDKIASRFGLLPQTIWDDGGNAELKRTRKDPNILKPGDVLVIPDLRLKEESVASNQRHRFLKKGAGTVLRLKLDDNQGPLANKKFTLIIDGQFFEGQTDGDGKVEHPIPANARRGSLLLEGEDAIALNFASMDPIDTISGVQKRLINMGYDCTADSAGTWGEASQAAMTAFQEANNLTANGTIDDASRNKIEELHGS